MLVPDDSSRKTVAHYFKDKESTFHMRIEMTYGEYNAHGFIDVSPSKREIQELEDLASKEFGIRAMYTHSEEVL